MLWSDQQRDDTLCSYLGLTLKVYVRCIDASSDKLFLKRLRMFLGLSKALFLGMSHTRLCLTRHTIRERLLCKGRNNIVLVSQLPSSC